MTASALTIMLYVDDIRAAIAFYQSIGFELDGTDEPHYGEGQINWAMLHMGGAKLMLSINGGNDENKDVSLYLTVDNADEFHAAIRDKVAITDDLKDQFYGVRDFWFRDPFGFHWGAGHPLNAVS